MEAFNGGKVISIPMAYEYELLPIRSMRSNLLKHRAKKYYYLVDRLLMVNSELRMILSYVRDKVSVNWYKTIRGAIIGLVLVRYMMFHLNPQWYQFRMDLVFYANYSIIKNYLQRIIKVLIKNYGLEDKYYKLYITPKNLQMLSKLWAKDMYDDSIKMMEHYHKLKSKTS